MDWGMIGLWVGIGITFLLGLFNLFWGGGVLSHRDRVRIREPIIETHLILHRRDTKPYLDFLSKFKLVRSRGEKDLYFESVYVRCNKVIISKIEPFFVLPGDEIYGSITYNGEYLGYKKKVSLKVNEPVEFEISEEFLIQNSLLEILNEEESQRNSIKSQQIMDDVWRLGKKFKIVWRDGRGREWQHRVPEKFWHRFLPDFVWWKIA